jgi:hypothetical protein
MSTRLPEGFSREFRASKTVNELKNELMNLNHASWLDGPIYKVTVKYFSPKNPLKVVYSDEPDGFLSWCEYIGNIHAVCLTHLTGFEVNEETRQILPRDEYNKLHKALYKEQYPIHNGRPPIVNVYDLCSELEKFSDDMLIAECYYNIQTKVSSFDTICDAVTTPSYYDGYPHDFLYSDDGQFITGYTKVNRDKVELSGSCMSDTNFYDNDDQRHVVYTNVDSGLIQERRQIFEEGRAKWIEYKKNIKTNFN